MIGPVNGFEFDTWVWLNFVQSKTGDDQTVVPRLHSGIIVSFPKVMVALAFLTGATEDVNGVVSHCSSQLESTETKVPDNME